jgi:uncharacterized protein (TIGR00661 family)
MRIVYGVHGYGRGHAMRALAVLPHLKDRHELLVLAGGDAYQALWPEYAVVRIPDLRYHYTRKGKLSNFLTCKHNLPAVLDLFLQGPALGMVMDTIADFRPDVIITDSDAYTHHAARRLKIPRITFDHFGVLVYCRPEMNFADRIRCRGNAFVYQSLFGEPERAVVSSFFDAPAKRRGVKTVGPIIRREVRDVTPRKGNYLLVYLSQGHHQYTPQLEQALLELDCPVRIYGTPRRGMQNNLQFKPLANIPFIEDLAGCRAILATTGNQLCGEILYFGKPMLGVPMNVLEQRLNAIHIEKMGFGKQISTSHIDGRLLKDFLAREKEYARNAGEYFRDGTAEAVAAIEEYAAELTTPNAQEQDKKVNTEKDQQ